MSKELKNTIIVFAILAVVAVALFYNNDDIITPKEETTATTESEQTTISKTERPENAFDIVEGSPGLYGKMITYNKNTEFEENFYAYYVPYGTYTATNKGVYTIQLNVYSDAIHTPNGWEEPVDTACVVLIDPGKTVTITVPTGYHIETSARSHIEMAPVE